MLGRFRAPAEARLLEARTAERRDGVLAHLKSTVSSHAGSRAMSLRATRVYGRPFVKRFAGFALYYRIVVCPISL